MSVPLADQPRLDRCVAILGAVVSVIIEVPLRYTALHLCVREEVCVCVLRVCVLHVFV